MSSAPLELREIVRTHKAGIRRLRVEWPAYLAPADVERVRHLRQALGLCAYCGTHPSRQFCRFDPKQRAENALPLAPKTPAQMRRAAVRARYNRSPKGRAANARYARSEKGRARAVDYNRSDLGRLRALTFNRSEKGRAAKARYEKSDRSRLLHRLRSMRYRNRLADARDDALLAALRGDTPRLTLPDISVSTMPNWMRGVGRLPKIGS